MSLMIKSDRVYLGHSLQPAALSIEDAVIGSIVRGAIPETQDVIDLTGYRVLPGLIDTHMHGCGGYDTMDCKQESIEAMSRFLACEAGVTTFCPTTVTSTEERTRRAVEVAADCAERGVPGAKIGGVYLEGPYINPKMKGAHPEELIHPIDLRELQGWIDSSRGRVCTVAIAPEREGACEAIEYLAKQKIGVAIGHSDATCEQADAAIRAGARACIHIYNAMRPLHHREPGILGASLTSDGFAAELICDGVHVHPRSMQVVTRCKRPEDIVLITDCMCAGGMPDGRYELGELPVVVEGGVARTEGGALAGSTLKLIDGLKNVVRLADVPFETAVRFATENPARRLGLFESIGSLEQGKAADLIAIDNEYRVVFCMVDGRVIADRR